MNMYSFTFIQNLCFYHYDIAIFIIFTHQMLIHSSSFLAFNIFSDEVSDMVSIPHLFSCTGC